MSFTMSFTSIAKPLGLKRNRLLQNVVKGASRRPKITSASRESIESWLRRWPQGRGLSLLPRTPVPEGEQALDVLAGGDQQGLYVYLLQPSEPESPQAVPVFGLGEQRLDHTLLLRKAFS